MVVDVKALLSNNPIKLSVHPVTPLAGASVAPVWPAAYRVRYTGFRTQTREGRRVLLDAPELRSPTQPAVKDTMALTAFNNVGFDQRVLRSGASGARKLPVSPARSGSGVSHPSAKPSHVDPLFRTTARSGCNRAAAIGRNAAVPEAIVTGVPYNNGINATGRPVTPLAKNASVAPVHPARYACR